MNKRALRRVFDAEFYLRANPDVAAARMDPLRHYIKFGAAEQRQPHPLFDPAHYGNSLLHFLQRDYFLQSHGGKWPGTHPLFDCDAYAAVRPGVNPLVDYVQRGSPTATEGSQFGQC